MDFVAIKYTGKKPYRDRTSLRNQWEPGDTKLVPADEAKHLLRFAEFKPGKAPQDEASVKQAKAAKQSAEAVQKQAERTEIEVLNQIEQMDKDALEEYAKKYGEDLDKRRSLETLRNQVAMLVETHGAI